MTLPALPVEEQGGGLIGDQNTPYLNNQGPVPAEDNNKSIWFIWLFGEE